MSQADCAEDPRPAPFITRRYTARLVVALSIAVAMILGCGAHSTVRAPQGAFEGCGVAGTVRSENFKIVEFPGNGPFLEHFYHHASTLGMDAVNGDVRILFYDDRSSPGAFALPYGTEPGDRFTILFGERMLMENSFPKSSNSLETVIMWAILAHEFAHLSQFQSGVRGPTRSMELMADVMSGWYVAMVLSRADQQHIDGQRASHAARALYALGDYQFNNPDHHGTPDQRLEAFVFGLSLVADRHVTHYWIAFESAAQVYLRI